MGKKKGFKNARRRASTVRKRKKIFHFLPKTFFSFVSSSPILFAASLFVMEAFGLFCWFYPMSFVPNIGTILFVSWVYFIAIALRFLFWACTSERKYSVAEREHSQIIRKLQNVILDQKRKLKLRRLVRKMRRAELDEIRGLVLEKNQKIENLQNDNADFLKQIEISAARLAEAVSEKNKVFEDLKNSELKVAILQDENDQFGGKIDENRKYYTGEVVTLRRQLQERDKVIADNAEEKKKLESEVVSQKGKVAELETRAKELQTKLADSEQRASNRLINQKGKLESEALKKNATLREEIKLARERIEILDAENQNLRRELADLPRLKDDSARLSTLLKEIEELTSQLNTLRTEYDSISARTNQTSLELIQLREENVNLSETRREFESVKPKLAIFNCLRRQVRTLTRELESKENFMVVLLEKQNTITGTILNYFGEGGIFERVFDVIDGMVEFVAMCQATLEQVRKDIEAKNDSTLIVKEIAAVVSIEVNTEFEVLVKEKLFQFELKSVQRQFLGLLES